MVPMNVDKFFETLPPEEFQIFETELREALIHVAAKAKDLGLPGGRFPLHAWIDKRLGGEIATSSNAQGYLEISLIAAGGNSTQRVDEAFFSGLKEDSFSQEEAALRESIFDFLASWQSPELATANDLSSDPNVTACVKAFLPPSVTLAEWIERRIGGEVELNEGIVQVLPEARKIVSGKYQALLTQRHAPGQATTVPARFPPPPPPAKGGKGGKVPAQPAAVESKEQWFQSLPQNELTGDEVTLRQALLDWLDAWPRRPGAKGGGAPLLGDAMNDARVTMPRLRFLPRNVSLKEWIEARIGGELELRENARNQVEVVRGGGEGTQDPNGILDSLPEDALNEQELELRQAVLGLLSASRCRLPQLSQNPTVMLAKRKFLPDEVALSEWIDRRIGGEVEITADNWVRARNGSVKEEPQTSPGFKGAGKDNSKGKAKNGIKGGKFEAGQDSKVLAEQFFKNLPAQSFTEAEESLRDTILSFLEHWQEEDAPTLSKAMLDPEIRRCKQDVLPKGNIVSLKDWIDRRLGGELEILRNDSGNLVIGVCGDSQPVKREAAEDWEQSPGKMPRVEEE